MNLPDGVLVQRVLGGEVEAYGLLVKRYRAEFARYATSLCGDRDLAADAMQEAFIRAFDSLSTCREPERFKAWFFRILTNQCHNARTRSKPHVSLDDLAPVAEESPRDPAEGAEIREAIETALETLTTEQREAFVLKHVEGLSYAEMAALLGTSEDALKMRVHRARDTLRRLLEPVR
jgi:RNA polymerase sigma-70 factor (ECF subfamily)